MFTGREVLLYFSLKYEGDWEKIYDAIMNKEEIEYEKEQFYAYISQIKCSYITIMDELYPSILKRIHRPPFVLFYYGKISYLNSFNKTLAVVGSRDYSEYGKYATTKIIKELPDDFVIISGLAKGIDSIAHRCAIETHKKTIAILGNGIDFCYLKENQSLYETIKNEHLVMSEYPNHVSAKQEQFPIRNRIIAGLSKAIFVPECKLQSGTMITINYAIEQYKDVFCVPHQINVESGCNHLISQGAYLVQSGDDIASQFSDGDKNVK